MRNSSYDVNIEYLMGFLKDEFSDIEEARIHPVFPSSTTKAPDLPQDYDPNENDIHLLKGVRIRIGSREAFFPASWVSENKLDQMHALIKEIRNYLL